MPIARVDKSNKQLQALFTTSGSPELLAIDEGTAGPEIFSRTSSGASGITQDASGPQTPAGPVADLALDLQNAVDLLKRYNSSSTTVSKQKTTIPPPLTLPPVQQDPLAGPSSAFFVKPDQEPASFHERPQGRRAVSGSRKTSATPLQSPTTTRHYSLAAANGEGIDALYPESGLVAGPSSAPIDSPLNGVYQPWRLGRASQSTAATEPASMRHTAPTKRARSRHGSKAGADHGFGGARLGSLSFSSLSLNNIASLELPPRGGLSPTTEFPGREVIMTPTTEEYRFFAQHEPDIEEDESSDRSPGLEQDEKSAVSASSESDDGLSLYKIGSDSSHRRNSSFASGPPQRVVRRRRESVRSDDGGETNTDDLDSADSSLQPEQPVVVPATPLPGRTTFGNAGVQVISSTQSLGTDASPSPHTSPLSRAPSPVSLSHSGPLDPRAYSARSRYRTIHSFQIEEEDAGQGAYGLVKYARERGPSGQPQGPELIIKYIIKQRILADCWKKHKLLGPLPVEIHVLDHLRRTPTATFLPGGSTQVGATGHPNICSMLDFFEDAEHYYMVMPRFGEGEDLFDYVEAAPDGLSSVVMLNIFGQIADALCFLHSVGIVHRDIKDENVILDGHGRVQLIDFGSAAYVREGRKFDTFSGTLDFAAPEVLRGERYEAREADVWALGALGYVLLCGECPFWNSEETIIGLVPGSRSRQALEAKRSTAPEAVDLLLSCLAVESSDRPTARDICRHAAFDRESGWRGHLGWRMQATTHRRTSE